ncbi:MAG: transporter substrate-binding domain-containing protein [Eubacteriales bacterium]|jgi:ABC-type amino acid transport substrate-binding protein
MNTCKKVLLLLLAAALILCCFTGCKKEAKTLTMGTNAAFPPYEYYEGDKIVGIDAEIAAEIAKKLGRTLVIEDMEFGSIITAVQGGKIDMGMAGMTVNETRLQSVNFSTTYATGIQVVIVKEDSDIETIDDLMGKKIGVQESTTGDIYASATPEDGGFGEENVERYNKGTEAVLALTQGKVDAVIIDNEPAKAFVKANEGLMILETEYAVEDYAIAIRKENTELLQQVDKALKELIADGTVKAIVDKYIHD